MEKLFILSSLAFKRYTCGLITKPSITVIDTPQRDIQNNTALSQVIDSCKALQTLPLSSIIFVTSFSSCVVRIDCASSHYPA